MQTGLVVDPNRVASYIRWSTEEQGEGTTLEVQQDACRHYILAQGWCHREEMVFVDEGYSGGSLDRPGLNALRKAVGEGAVTCVVVFKLDRLSRSVLDTVSLILDEWDGLCYVKSTREPVDTTTPAGKMFFYMLASYAEWERSVIRERTMGGKAKRAQQGKNPGFRAPYGYRHGDKAGDLLIAAEDAVVVRRIFREYLAGRGFHAIADGLTADGLRPPRSVRWHPTTIAQVLANPIYAGTLAYGRSSIVSGRMRGRGGPLRVRFERPRYACVEGAVPAIITRDQFDRAQRRRQQRSANRGRRPAGAEFLLSGTARCRCGSHLRGDTRSGSGYRYYRCGRTVAGPSCAAALIPADPLEQVVLQRVREFASGASQWVVQLDEERDEARTSAEEVGAHIRQSLQQLARRRERLDADYDTGDLPARIYSERIARLEEEEGRLREPLARAQVEAEALQAATCDLSEAGRLDGWERLGPDEKRRLVRLAVRSCQVYRERAEGGRSNQKPVEVDLLLLRPPAAGPPDRAAV